MIFVFDTETTGLPEKRVCKDDYDYLIKYQNCRMVEFAYKLYSTDGTETKQFRTYIKPDNFEIKNSHIHGITQDKAVNEGITLEELFSELNPVIKDVTLLVGHNVHFDINVLIAECIRYKNMDLVQAIRNKPSHCTMILGQQKYRMSKFPKLIELYRLEFNEDFESAHTALADCEAAAKCYFNLRSRL